MSQLPEQLLKPANIPMMMPMGQNMGLINTVPIPQQIQNQPNLALNQNIGMGVPGPEHKSQQNQDTKRHRRSKHEQEGRIFACDCGKSFLSQPALNNHKKTKHPELLEGQPKRGRGRPRKYPPKTAGDFETTKYEIFFTLNNRAPEEGVNIDMKDLVQEVFHFLYEGNYANKLFSHPKTYEENPILKNLADNADVVNKQKNEKTCDEVFYEYLHSFKNKTNKKYLTLLTKFVLLFRECYDNSKNKENKEETKKPVTDSIPPEGLPDLCNEFYGEFMEPNNFFGIEEPDEKNEIIEIIQHFCIWLFKNEYTKSKLSLAS